MVLDSGQSGKKRGGLVWRLLGLNALLSLGVGASLAGQGQQAPVRLVATGHRMGTLGPCGCPTVPRGGMDRLIEWATQSRGRGELLLWVDSGNNLFPLEQLIPDLATSWRERALLMADGFRELGIRVSALGAKDVGAGTEFLKEWAKRAGLEWVAANLPAHPGGLWKRWVKVELGGDVWGVTGLAGAVFPGAEGTRWPLEDTETALGTVFAEMSSHGVRNTLLLSPLDLKENQHLATRFKPTLLVGSSEDMLDAPIGTDAHWLLQERREGQSVFVYSRGSQPEEIWMDARWDPKTPSARAYRRRMDALVREQGRRLGSVGPKSSGAKVQKPNPKSAFVANPYVCKKCHEPQYRAWEKTKHASAYLVLYAKGQHLDPECVACHSLGLNEPGGFTSVADPLLLEGAPDRKSGEKPLIASVLEKVFQDDGDAGALDSREDPRRYEKLKARYHQEMDSYAAKPGWKHVYAGVQCEHCHGNRADHVATRTKGLSGRRGAKVKATICLECHNDLRDPAFSFSVKQPQISCTRPLNPSPK